jgi:hypothetical protein
MLTQDHGGAEVHESAAGCPVAQWSTLVWLLTFLSVPLHDPVSADLACRNRLT